LSRFSKCVPHPSSRGLTRSNFPATDPIAQANPKLAQLKDDDGRLPIHWAVSYNHPEIVSLLISQKGFDPDAEVGLLVASIKHYIHPKIVAD
jgi:ankyrin repeat protein